MIVPISFQHQTLIVCEFIVLTDLILKQRTLNWNRWSLITHHLLPGSSEYIHLSVNSLKTGNNPTHSFHNPLALFSPPRMFATISLCLVSLSKCATTTSRPSISLRETNKLMGYPVNIFSSVFSIQQNHCYRTKSILKRKVKLVWLWDLNYKFGGC